MKPRHNYEKDAYAMRKHLPALSYAQMNWVAGQDYEQTRAEYEERKKKVTSTRYFSIVTSCRGWQVVRYVLARSEYSRNGYTFLNLAEVSQRWMRITDKGGIELSIFEKAYAMNGVFHCHPYALSTPLSLKGWSDSYNRKGITRFLMGDEEVYPHRRFSKDFKDAGLTKYVGRYDEIWLYEDAPKKAKMAEVSSHYSERLDKSGRKKLSKMCYLPNKVETLFKIGEKALAHMFMADNHHAYLLQEYWASFLIARRNGFRNIDWALWLDYVDDLARVGKDIHSPKYLCPDDIGVAHAKLLAKIEAERAREQAKRDAERAVKEEGDYKKRMEKFFGLFFTTKSGLTITPFTSVQSILEEGIAMHHCVYQCGYYKADKHCLLLTAKDGEGNRVETIRVDLPTMKVAESRGLCNKSTPFHNEIVKAMEENMWQIEEIAYPTEKVLAMAS